MDSIFAHRFLPADRRKSTLDMVKEGLEVEAERAMAKAAPAQQQVMRDVFEGRAVGDHPAVGEVHTFEASRDGVYILAHRTYRFRDSGDARLDYRTQLFRIAPDGSVRSI